jgi:hypothetical protein
MKKIIQALTDNWKVITLTFEIFWLIVFLLGSLANKSATEIPQFVYVNF